MWRIFLRAFLRYRTVVQIRLHTHQSPPAIVAMARVVRAVMAADMPETLAGVVEADETYIGAQWRNRPWRIRKHGTKKGRGTSKQAVFGLLERKTGTALTFLVPNVRKETLMPIIVKYVAKGSILHTDAYQLYQETPKEGYVHAFVDHKQHEYARGDVHSNSMEGFWAILKRRLKTTGGIRVERRAAFVAEETWRHNQRKLSETQKVERLLDLLKKGWWKNV
jgi:transposase-like protein